MSEIKVGDRVTFNDSGAFLRASNPVLYPKTGTVGTVKDVIEHPSHNLCRCLVDWDGFHGKAHILDAYLEKEQTDD